MRRASALQVPHLVFILLDSPIVRAALPNEPAISPAEEESAQLELLTVPAPQDALALRTTRYLCRTCSSMVDLIAQNNLAAPVAIDDTEAISLAKKIMTLAADHLAARIAGAGLRILPAGA